ncbi:DUF4307 domain-containing protein [Streptomyces zagrosensis]|uniref:DUF4307 domain-containing protein n=1 Tax=Streptomyces zagrosensis TaxID=1042984 RepID=A0A7W9QFG9_9ACTN|nr:DUF4307 domain-containing protein [Streptomyces zagrosensis]MBB5938247.1 hypothetical protein [Streptomyces zagrosensis]
MATVRDARPDGRYGRSADERADRKLKIVGAVLGAGLLGVIAWVGISYVSDQDVSGRVIAFKVVSNDAVEVHLEVLKDRDGTGVCTVRSQSEEGVEVGRKDFRFDQRQKQVDTVVTLRTTERATSAELVECKASDG